MIRWLCLAFCLALCLASPAQATCRQALAIGLDVSGSVDAREYRLQTDGLAAALEDPAVRAAFFAMPGAYVDLLVYEWSGQNAQRLLQGWTAIRTEADLAKVADRLRRSQRDGTDRSTALGQAKLFGRARLAERPECWRHILDLTGDGKSNDGPPPESVRQSAMTINALVIGLPAQPQGIEPGLGELVGYFKTKVIEGPEAFTMTALGFDSFAEAMTRKLLRELQVIVIGDAKQGP